MACTKSMAALVLCAVSAGANAASFVPLAGLPGGSVVNNAYGISGDGLIVVGLSHGPAGSFNAAARWTADGQRLLIAPPPSGNLGPLTDASFDGSVVVGSGFREASMNPEPYSWSSVAGVTWLGDLPGGIMNGQQGTVGTAISDDGSTGAGFGGSPEGVQAFRWSESTGMTGLGSLPGETFWSRAWNVSADGGVIVGESISANPCGYSEAFRWTEPTGMVGLGGLADVGTSAGCYESAAYGVSGDGLVIVGASSSSAYPFEPFRWTAESGMVGLGIFPSLTTPQQGKAYETSGDGSVVVGVVESCIDNQCNDVTADAFIWTEATGMLRLFDLLIAQGVTNITPSDVAIARGISADGRTIVGDGGTDGNQGWIVTVDPITVVPIPPALLLFGSALGLMGVMRRKLSS